MHYSNLRVNLRSCIISAEQTDSISYDKAYTGWLIWQLRSHRSVLLSVLRNGQWNAQLGIWVRRYASHQIHLRTYPKEVCNGVK